MNFGEDGILVKMQLEELIEDLPQEELLIVKDYIAPSRRLVAEKILENIKNISQEEFIKSGTIAKALG